MVLLDNDTTLMSEDDAEVEDSSEPSLGQSSGQSVPAFRKLVQKSIEQHYLDNTIASESPNPATNHTYTSREPIKIPLWKLFNFSTVDEWMPHLAEKSVAISQQEMELNELLAADPIDSEEDNLDVTAEQVLFGVDIH